MILAASITEWAVGIIGVIGAIAGLLSKVKIIKCSLFNGIECQPDVSTIDEPVEEVLPPKTPKVSRGRPSLPIDINIPTAQRDKRTDFIRAVEDK